MEIQLTEREIIGDRRGKIAAGIGFILVIVLLLIPVFFFQNPPPGQPGILVNLGLIDVGQGDNNAGPSRPAEQPAPEPEPATPPPPAPEVRPDPQPEPPTPAARPEPKPVQREVIQQETPAEVALRKQKAEAEARRRAEEQRKQDVAEAEARRVRAAQEAENRKKAEEERQRREAAAAAARAQAQRDAEAAATRDAIGGLFGNGGGRGDTGKPGNQGVDDGDPNADRLRGISTGDGRVSGGLGGRGVLASPPVQENSQVSGTVVVSICVGSDGNVIGAPTFSQNGSTTNNPQLVNAAIANARKWRFSAGAAERQCGKISYNFKVQ